MGFFKDLKKVKKNVEKAKKKVEKSQPKKSVEPEPKLRSKSFKLTRFNAELYAKSDEFDLIDGDNGYEVVNDNSETVGICPASVTDYLDEHIDDYNGCVEVDENGKATAEFIW